VDEVIHLVNIRDSMVIAELGNCYSIFILIRVWEGTKMAKELSGSIRLCNSSGFIRHID